MAKECGPCSLCCKTMAVPEIDKEAGEWCGHFEKGTGCTVYLKRPLSCKKYRCMWVDSGEEVGEDLRPDKLGMHFHKTIINDKETIVISPGTMQQYSENIHRVDKSIKNSPIPVVVAYQGSISGDISDHFKK